MNKSDQIIQFTLVYNRHKVQIYNYVRKLITDSMICDDIVQNVFIKLYLNMETIKNMTSVNFWLFKTTRNEIFSFLRKKKIQKENLSYSDNIEEEIEDPDNFFENYELSELKKVIMSELDLLPFEQKEIYLLKEYGRLSYKEIAEILEINEELVKSRLYKTRQKLIKIITPIFR